MNPYHFFTHDLRTDKSTHRWIRLLQVVLAMELSIHPMPIDTPHPLLTEAFKELHDTLKQWVGFDDTQNRWRQARTTETHLDDSTSSRWLDIGARQGIYILLEADASVQDTIKDLFIWYIKERVKHRRCPSWDKARQIWTAGSENMKRTFLATMDISERDITSKLAAVDRIWNPDDPWSRQGEAYHEAMEDSSDPQRYGDLGTAISQFVAVATDTHREFTHLGFIEEYQDNSEDIDSWCETLTSPEQVVDTECPICREKYEYPSHGRGKATRIPLKARCEHVVCKVCFRKWSTSKSPNFDKCALCRTRFWHMPAYAEHWKPLYETMIDVFMYPEDAAESIAEDLNPYLSSLRKTLNYKAPVPFYQNGLATLTNTLLGSTKAVVDWHMWNKGYTLLHYAQATADYIEASGERLEAFRDGKAQEYRRAVKKQFNIQVQRMIIRFCIELNGWERYLAAEQCLVNTWAWHPNSPGERQGRGITNVNHLEDYNHFWRETDEPPKWPAPTIGAPMEID